MRRWTALSLVQSPVRHQDITWTILKILSIGPMAQYSRKTGINDMHLRKMSAWCWPSSSDLYVFIYFHDDNANHENNGGGSVGRGYYGNYTAQKFGITSLLWCFSSMEIWNEHCTESMRYIIFRSFDTQCISVLVCYKNLGLRNVCKSRHIKSLWWNIFLSNSTRQYIYITQCWVIFDVASCYLSGLIKR